MSNPRDVAAYVSNIAGAHLEVARRLGQLRALLRAAQEQAWVAGATRPIESPLRDLCCYLRQHFAREEAGGYLEEAMTRLPRLQSQVVAVIAEHDELLRGMKSLEAELALAAEEPALWPPLAQRIAALLDQLARHEKAENALLEQGFNISMSAENGAARP